AEWQTLDDLLRAAGGAASRLRTSLEGLAAHSDRMAANLAMSSADSDAGHAGDLVDRLLAERP
ncbi:MAG: 3-carboxy-cis,cis-muconate cycloisomerase, partial [Pseudonocardiales bacterium]|nr:3-carboxy-cis,cis-muconate cycloisomerase [Pseudonocardiales bacterium]